MQSFQRLLSQGHREKLQKKKLVVILKGRGAKTNSLAGNRQS
jgi:hypothetical protein